MFRERSSITYAQSRTAVENGASLMWMYAGLFLFVTGQAAICHQYDHPWELGIPLFITYLFARAGFLSRKELPILDAEYVLDRVMLTQKLRTGEAIGIHLRDRKITYHFHINGVCFSHPVQKACRIESRFHFLEIPVQLYRLAFVSPPHIRDGRQSIRLPGRFRRMHTEDAWWTEYNEWLLDLSNQLPGSRRGGGRTVRAVDLNIGN